MLQYPKTRQSSASHAFRSLLSQVPHWILGLLACAPIAPFPVSAEDGAVKVEVVLEGLVNPCGVACSGEPGAIRVFVSNSGKGEILKVHPNAPAKAELVIRDFPFDANDAPPTLKVGPLGIAFWDATTLLVAGGREKSGGGFIRAYGLPEEGATKKFDEVLWEAGPLPMGPDSNTSGSVFLGLGADKRTALFVTCDGDSNKGWIARAPLNAAGVGELKPFIKTQVETGVEGPSAITLSPDGELVVAQRGAWETSQDSLLSFYHAKTGQMLKYDKVDLYDMSAVKYSSSGRLYALDLAWANEGAGGLFRLDQSLEGVHAVLVAKLDRPAAMDFAADGSLFVVLFGSSQDKSAQGSGKLVKITGNL